MEKELEKIEDLTKEEEKEEKIEKYLKIDKFYIYDLFDNKKNKIELDTLEIKEMEQDELSSYRDVENKKSAKIEDKGIPVQGFRIKFKPKNIIENEEEEDYKSLELIIYCLSKNQRLYKVALYDEKDIIETDVIKAYSTSNLESLVKEVIKRYFRPEYTLEESEMLKKEEEKVQLEEYEDEVDVEELIKEMGIDEEEEKEISEDCNCDNNLMEYETEEKELGDVLKEEFDDDISYDDVVNEEDVILDEDTYEEIKKDLPGLSESVIKKISNKIYKKLNEEVEGYLEYLAEKWVRRNIKAIKENEEYKRYKEIVDSVIGALVENYIIIKPIEKDKEEELLKQIREKNRELNKLYEENMELSKKYKELLKEKILMEETIGLSEYKKEKIKKLVENKRFNNLLEYRDEIIRMKKELFESNMQRDSVKRKIMEENEFTIEENKDREVITILEEINKIYKGV